MKGTFRVPVRVFSLADPSVGRELDMLVDTGATQSIVPREVLEALHVPVDRRQKFPRANGERIDRDVGWVRFRCQERTTPTQAVFGEPQDGVVLGRITLHELGLEVDPTTETLSEAEAYMYRFAGHNLRASLGSE